MKKTSKRSKKIKKKSIKIQPPLDTNKKVVSHNFFDIETLIKWQKINN